MWTRVKKEALSDWRYLKVSLFGKLCGKVKDEKKPKNEMVHAVDTARKPFEICPFRSNSFNALVFL